MEERERKGRGWRREGGKEGSGRGEGGKEGSGRGEEERKVAGGEREESKRVEERGRKGR